MSERCPCQSGRNYDECCGPLIAGDRQAETAEALMRSRYTAHVKVAVDYLMDTVHPNHRDGYDREVAKDWAENADWEGLEIVSTEAGGPDDDTGKVEFIAHFQQDRKTNRHHELAQFSRYEGVWKFVDGEFVKPKPVVRKTPKIGRNDICFCGSGKKYKKCCLRLQRSA